MSSIKEKLNNLVVLQKFEDEISIIEKELAEVDGRIDALSGQLNEYEEKVAQSHHVLEQLKKQYRSDESEMQMVEAQIAKSEEKLGVVKTNKEYQSILKEIDDLKAKTSLIEDRMLEALDQNELVEHQIRENKADLAEVKIQVEEKRAVIREHSEQRKIILERRQQERDSLLDRLTPDIIDRYSKVKRQGRGIAIAAVVDAVCQVCRMNIPPQLFNELMRMDSMHMCPNCQRIIYPKARLEEG